MEREGGGVEGHMLPGTAMFPQGRGEGRRMVALRWNNMELGTHPQDWLCP